jgi:ABC-type sugar transport system ATPase subunit
LVRELKGRGITIIYVSHRMEELFELCDTISVLRDGRHVSTGRIRDTTPHDVVTQMIGRELLIKEPRHLQREPGEVRLAVRDLASAGKFSGINLSVRAGEVVGVAGLVGAGRSEVMQAIFGLDAGVSGEVVVAGQPLPRASIDAALAAGVGLMPEDRKRLGLVLPLNCRENTALAALPRLTKCGWVRRSEERSLARRYLERLRVKTPSMEAVTAGLSGGNQQKIALAKWLACKCDVMLVDEPTRGVDVGAKAEIYELLDELACEGKALLVVSSELPELIGLCRRILVMREGRLVGEVVRSEFSEAGLMRLMAGVDARAA